MSESDGASKGPTDSRRQFVVLCGVGSCAIAGAVAVPGAIFVASPLKGSGEARGKRFVVARLDELELNVPKRFSVVGDELDAWTKAQNRRLGSVWLTRTADRTVRALSVICPHLGCGIELSPDAHQFACPCHDSSFDLTGKRVGGPSPRPMDELEAEVGAGGEVSVSFRRYRIGVESKEEIG